MKQKLLDDLVEGQISFCPGASSVCPSIDSFVHNFKGSPRGLPWYGMCMTF